MRFDRIAVLATPPWCEHAPRPFFAVVPSLHVTCASSFAAVLAAAGRAMANAARSEIPMFRRFAIGLST